MSTDQQTGIPVPVTYRWSQPNVIPPRCRKPRTVYHTGEAEVRVPSVTQDEAPIAFLVDGTVLRWYDERLFTRYLPASKQTEDEPASRYFGHQHSLGHQPGNTLEEVLEYVTMSFRRFLVIDGVVWQETTEPHYRIMTFGMGGNHGGTSLTVEHYYAGDGDGAWRFRADDFHLARREAAKVAEARGDTESAASIRTMAPRIVILIDEAVRIPDPQTEYTRAKLSDARQAAIEAHNEVDRAVRAHIGTLVRAEFPAAAALNAYGEWDGNELKLRTISIVDADGAALYDVDNPGEDGEWETVNEIDSMLDEIASYDEAYQGEHVIDIA